MEIKWNSEQRTVMNETFVGAIMTGETQAVANWRTALSMQRSDEVWESACEQIGALAGAGRDLVADRAQMEDINAEGKLLSVVFGIRSTGVTPRGRTEGTYYFVLCMREERLLVFDAIFNYRKQIKRMRRGA